jgi:hypothetical protein
MEEVYNAPNSLKIHALTLVKQVSENLLKDLDRCDVDKINKCYEEVIDNLSFESAGLDQWSIYRQNSEEVYDDWVDDYKNWDSVSIELSDLFRDKYLPSVTPNDLDGSHLKSTLYAYVHGGVAVSLTPFNCQWDSGAVGVVRYKKGANPIKLIARLNAALQGYTSYVLHSEDGDGYEFAKREDALNYLKKSIADESLINKWLDLNFKGET